MTGVNKLARGMGWGLMIASLDAADRALSAAAGSVITDADVRRRIDAAHEAVRAASQAVWAAYERERSR